MIRTVYIVFTIWVAFIQHPCCHNHENHHTHGNGSHHHNESEKATSADKVKLVTGQGNFIFSWDQELTAAFPKDAIMFESRMHGSFNEDPETGIVYTGIPGYGLCSISPDLRKWTSLDR